MDVDVGHPGSQTFLNTDLVQIHISNVLLLNRYSRHDASFTNLIIRGGDIVGLYRYGLTVFSE